jgi:hypothetical protein
LNAIRAKCLRRDVAVHAARHPALFFSAELRQFASFERCVGISGPESFASRYEFTSPPQTSDERSGSTCGVRPEKLIAADFAGRIT